MRRNAILVATEYEAWQAYGKDIIMETRSVVDRISDGFEHGHREERRDASCP